MFVEPIQVTKNDVHFNVISNPQTVWIWNHMNRGEWEEETFKIFDRFLSPTHSYLDIGAWIGPTVLYGAHRAKHVYGIEPDPIAFQELLANCALNHSIASKITPINAAIAEESGDINLYMRHTFGDSTSSLVPTISDHSCKVRALTIYDLINNNNIQDINFIKMDIEGGEYTLIPQLQEFLTSHKPTLYLSLHPKFLHEHLHFVSIEDKTSPAIQTEKLLDSLQSYKNIYDISGNRVNRDHIHTITNTGEFVFTDENW
ncbi:FkbM family methyltransferase [Bacillus luti]|uniref:FkbM family methyltransferase n=1 Tax=Bacillus luti TaxID=2026191 RepID=A0A7V7S6W1_9BACI|nr:FkbM family methyltransferase [Bacillus luti]KAB2442439.1 FkbM family methyltransferase [Bacillus luti]